jgi:hypothetical protein
LDTESDREPRPWNKETGERIDEPHRFNNIQEVHMGRGILLWLLGIPLPIVILLVLFMR